MTQFPSFRFLSLALVAAFAGPIGCSPSPDDGAASEPTRMELQRQEDEFIAEKLFETAKVKMQASEFQAAFDDLEDAHKLDPGSVKIRDLYNEVSRIMNRRPAEWAEIMKWSSDQLAVKIAQSPVRGGTPEADRQPRRQDINVRRAPATGDERKPAVRDFDAEIAQNAAIADPVMNTEQYNPLVDNPFLRPFDAPLSTFSIDVDTASYANVRRFLNDGQLPPPDAVRLEEMVNYFHYNYAQPADGKPFSVALEARTAPWEPKHQLVRIGLQGKEIELSEAPPANLVFLVDVSGSMGPEDRLPLVQKSLNMLAETLREKDKVAIVVYAGNAGLVLPPTSGGQKAAIHDAIDRLSAGGSTNGGQGIELAYKLAADNFVKDGVNRVILATDGDFNVGVSSEGDLDRLIEEKRKTGVFLSVLGVGRGNYADARMQSLADKGNGNASYIDSLKEAHKVLVEQATGTLITIAKDVKIQVEFNPSKVAAYRLIGYENRLLAAQDFNDDKKDAGEIGAGHQVTALYEIIPTGLPVPAADVDSLKYQTPAMATAKGGAANELCTVKLRFKKPDGDVSEKIEFALDEPVVKTGGSEEFDFAAGVAAFAMCLRSSEYRGQASFALALELARGGLGDDAKGYRKELVELIKKAKALAPDVDPRAVLLEEVRKQVFAPVAGTPPTVNLAPADVEKAVDEFLKVHGQAKASKEDVDAIVKELMKKSVENEKK